MNVLGLRVSPKKIYYAIIDLEKSTVLLVDAIVVPCALDTPEQLKFIRNNLLDIIREYTVKRAGIKVTEGFSQTKSIPRIQIEGVIQEAFASSTIEGYYVGQVASISRRLGFRREAFNEYVNGVVNYPQIENWATLKKEERQAIFAALGAVDV